MNAWQHVVYAATFQTNCCRAPTQTQLFSGHRHACGAKPCTLRRKTERGTSIVEVSEVSTSNWCGRLLPLRSGTQQQQRCVKQLLRAQMVSIETTAVNTKTAAQEPDRAASGLGKRSMLQHARSRVRFWGRDYVCKFKLLSSFFKSTPAMIEIHSTVVFSPAWIQRQTRRRKGHQASRML